MLAEARLAGIREVTTSRFPDQRVGQLGFRVLGLDLDGVCADYVDGLREYCMLVMGLPREAFPDPTAYSLVDSGWPFRDTGHYLEVHRSAVRAGLYRNLKPYPGAPESLRVLSEASVHIRVISHRLFVAGLHAQVAADTAAWLDDHQIPYMSLCLTGLKDTVGSNVMVEDSPALIEAIRASGTAVAIFDQPYNQRLAGPRVKAWNVESVGRILGMFDSPHGEQTR